MSSSLDTSTAWLNCGSSLRSCVSSALWAIRSLRVFDLFVGAFGGCRFAADAEAEADWVNGLLSLVYFVYRIRSLSVCASTFSTVNLSFDSVSYRLTWRYTSMSFASRLIKRRNTLLISAGLWRLSIRSSVSSLDKISELRTFKLTVSSSFFIASKLWWPVCSRLCEYSYKAWILLSRAAWRSLTMKALSCWAACSSLRYLAGASLPN